MIKDNHKYNDKINKTIEFFKYRNLSMTLIKMDSRLRGNDGLARSCFIHHFEVITEKSDLRFSVKKPPAMPVVKMSLALALSKKPPMLYKK